MHKLTLILILCSISYAAQSQNIFPKALSNCVTDKFCLDCGDIKADVDAEKFASMIQKLNTHNNLNNLKGKILFQVLIDSTGKGCVLSHTDVANRILTQNMVMAFNDFDGWLPAKTDNKAVGRVSVNIAVEIANGKLTGAIMRMTEDFAKSLFDRAVDPKVDTAKYNYTNEHLKNYTFTVWNSKNSIMTDNLSDNNTVDKNDVVWYETNNDLYWFDGSKFFKVDESNSPFTKKTWFRSMATDNNNVKWFENENGIYSYDDTNWVKHNFEKTGVKADVRIDNIVNIEHTGEVFFATYKGLFINKGGVWSSNTNKKLKELPAERVRYAKRDSKNRTWIGTYKGSIMIDAEGKITAFDSGETFLNGKCIMGMAEDKKGNIYFDMYTNNDDVTGKNSNVGIGVLYANGNMKQLTSLSSGMASGAPTHLFYDKFEDVLWVSTFEAGLLRYDLATDSWENYHNKNSGLPTSAITCISQDSKGIIYLSTRYGMVRMKRK